MSTSPDSERGQIATQGIDLLIRDATVFRMVPDEDPLEHMDIVVHRGAIVGIEPTGTLEQLPSSFTAGVLHGAARPLRLRAELHRTSLRVLTPHS